MIERLSTQELIEKVIESCGVTRKLAEDWIRVLPVIIEEGLARDGEVKVRGLGLFKLKWVDRRIARNLKTGEEMEVPAHSRVTFVPETRLKERINEDFKFLTYQLIGEGAVGQQADSSKQSAVSSQRQTANGIRPTDISQQSAISSQRPTANGQRPTEISQQPAVSSELPTAAVQGSEELKKEPEVIIPPPPETKRTKIHWLIPLVFFLIVILAVIFYFRNCRGPLVFTPKDNSELELRPATTPAATPEVRLTDTVPEASDTLLNEPSTDSRQPAAADMPQPAPGDNPPTASKTVVTQGDWLFQLAREYYGNPFLWTLIYSENKKLIDDPQKVLDGVTLTIPPLEGTGRKLTRNDSLRVAEGYRLVTEYYESVNDMARAAEYRQGISRYTPR